MTDPTFSARKIELDPDHPFEKLLIPLVETNRKKSADYASPDDLYLNFRRNADMVGLPGYTPLVDAFSMVARKLGRIANLRGRSAANESVLDSYLDLTVYAILTYGLALEEAENEKQFQATQTEEADAETSSSNASTI